MKIIIMSDSHLKNDLVYSIINQYPEADYFIHCGDVGKEIELPKDKKIFVVKGNNDFVEFPKEIDIFLQGIHLFITHGHLYQVDNNLNLLYEKAKKNNYQVVCYGHTHDPKWEIKDGCHFINPGSVAFPRGGKIFIPTYCILENEEVHYYHAKTHECVDELFQPKKKESLFKRLLKK